MVVGFEANPVYFSRVPKNVQGPQRDGEPTERPVSRTSGDTDIFDRRCTDGKDDGKIGTGNALYHIGKGAVNGLVDMVKGCVMDENGDLSPTRMLMTGAAIGLGVLCPPAAAALCAVGAVVGGAKVAGGIYNIANAKTDAQMIEACENLGDGALTAAASVFGARASYGAIKTAATNAAKANGGSQGALEALAPDASKLDWLKALGTDSWSATKHNFGTARDSLTGKYDAFQLGRQTGKDADEIVKLWPEYQKAISKTQPLTQEEEALVTKMATLCEKNREAEQIALERITQQKITQAQQAGAGHEAELAQAQKGMHNILEQNLQAAKNKGQGFESEALKAEQKLKQFELNLAKDERLKIYNNLKAEKAKAPQDQDAAKISQLEAELQTKNNEVKAAEDALNEFSRIHKLKERIKGSNAAQGYSNAIGLMDTITGTARGIYQDGKSLLTYKPDFITKYGYTDVRDIIAIEAGMPNL